MQAPGERKDPFTALFLSLVFPGAGFAYVGDVRRFVIVAVVVFTILCATGGRNAGVAVAFAIHLFMAIASAGAAKNRNARLATTEIPPPPPAAARSLTADPRSFPPPPPPRREEPAAPPPSSSPSPPPPPPSTDPPLTSDAFLAELKAAWQERQAGAATDDAFAARKVSAIARVKVADWNDGVALLEAASSLVGAGVLTPAERNRLKQRIGGV